MRRLLLAFALFGCRAESVSHITVDAPCVRAICESTMSTVITETAANADFATGLTIPDSGEDPSVWSLILEQQIQKIGDRTQALRILAGANTSGQIERSLPLTIGWQESGSEQFALTLSSNHLYWVNDDITGSIGLHFPIDVPVGIKLVSIKARLDGGAFTGTSHASNPNTMPALTLLRQTDGVDTSVGTQSDTSVNAAAYDVAHDVTLTVNHTILTNTHYFLKLTGESGGTAANNKLTVLGLSMLLETP